MKKQLIYLQGAQGSGKTLFAQHFYKAQEITREELKDPKVCSSENFERIYKHVDTIVVTDQDRNIMLCTLLGSLAKKMNWVFITAFIAN